jgi:CHAT domain-containing protein
LAIREKALGPDHPNVAMSLNSLAELYRSQGRYTDAEPLYQRSLDILEGALSRDHPDVGTALNNLAALYQSQGRYADAEHLYQRSLDILERALGPDHPAVAKSLNNLALMYRKQGGDALPLIRRMISNKSAETGLALPVLFGAEINGLISHDEALEASLHVIQQSNQTAAALAINALAKRFTDPRRMGAGSNLLAALVRQDVDLTEYAARLNEAIWASVSKPPRERDPATEKAIKDRIAATATERQALRSKLAIEYPEYAALSLSKVLSSNEIMSLLAEDEALVVFSFGKNSYAWVISKAHVDWSELKVTADEITALVAALRKPIEQNRPHARFDAVLAHRIYEATFGAIASDIGGKKRISVVTNGALTGLPLQLLVQADPTGKHLKDVDWLVRSYAITILPSIGSLRVLRSSYIPSPAWKQKPMIAFADPVFSKKERARALPQQQLAIRSITQSYRGKRLDTAELAEHLPPLPGTRKEVLAIADYLNISESDIYLGLAATETRVKEAELDEYRIIYFATHGLVSGEIEEFARVKAEPALALTTPDKPSEHDDGLLQASEVAKLNLNADWVVLSACNTAAPGNTPGAEALSGLAQAFFVAGARSLIVSHWNVDDVAAARLMIATFLASSRDPKLSHAEALRQSMLAMIDGAKSDADADPRLWAPFVVVGEPAKPQ